MNIYGAQATSYYDLLKNTLSINSNTTLDFQKILSAATQKTESASAEEMLKDIYPDLKYHVVDSSGFKYWNRNDFPVHKVYQDTIDVEYLNSWKPTRPTSTGFEPDVQANLSTIPNGLHVVLIHPACQERMDKDPEYARMIAEKVNRYFETDYNTNKAIDPTFPKDRMSQVVCITEKGEIGYHQTVCEGPSAKDNDDVVLDNEMKNQFLFVSLQNSETAVKQILQEQAAQTAQQRLIYNYLYGIYGTNENDKNREIASYQGEQL